LSACSGGAANPQELLVKGADAMGQAQTLKFSIERQGDPISLDVAPGMSADLLGVEGAYQAPSSVHAAAKVQVGGNVGEADILWTADGAYVKLPPLLTSYTPINLEGKLDAADIFSTEIGIPYIMKEKLIDPALNGEENLDGVATYHITATAKGEDLGGTIGGTSLEPGDATVEVWIAKDTSQVVRILVTETNGSIWTVDFFDYGQPVEIPTP
jgi:hypothetical protein